MSLSLVTNLFRGAETTFNLSPSADEERLHSNVRRMSKDGQNANLF